jgi:hypothetical protein
MTKSHEDIRPGFYDEIQPGDFIGDTRLRFAEAARCDWRRGIAAVLPGVCPHHFRNAINILFPGVWMSSIQEGDDCGSIGQELESCAGVV